MGLIFSTTGRPSSVCPNCGTMKAIDKKRNFTKESLRFSCPKCKTNWQATPDELTKIRAYFSAKRENGRPRTRNKDTDPPKETKSKEQSKKHSIWDKLI